MKRVALHAGEWTAHAAVQTALGLSRQALHQRSVTQGFPCAVQRDGAHDGRVRFYKTEDLARWLIQHGYTVVWI